MEDCERRDEPAGCTRRRFLSGCLAAAGSLLLPRAGWGADPLRVGETPPPFRLPDLAGNDVAFPELFVGKVTLLHFWASWCPFCVKEIRGIEALFQAHREEGFAPFSVNVGETRAAAESYLTGLRVTYPILFDASSAIARRYGVTGIPTTFVCDRAGAVRFKVHGEVNQAGLEKVLRRLL